VHRPADPALLNELSRSAFEHAVRLSHFESTRAAAHLVRADGTSM